MIALVAALGGSAVAEVATTSKLDKKEKKQVKKLAKKQANKQIDKKASGLSVASAANAVNADKVDGSDAADLETTTASTFRDPPGTPDFPLSTSDATVLTKDITIPKEKTVTAIASVEAYGDGGGNDRMNCNLETSGTDGVRQSTDVDSNGVGLPLVQTRTLAAGTHTVLISCGDGGASTVTVEGAALSIVATG